MPDDFYREIREVFEDSAYPVCIMTASKPALSLTDNIHRTEILCGQLFDAGQKSFSLHAHYTDANDIMADEILTFISKGYECLYSNEKQISLYKSLAWAFEQRFLLYKLSGREFFVYDANIESQATHNSELLLSRLEYPPIRSLDDVINIFRNIKGEDYFVEDKIIMRSRWMRDNFGKQARAWVSADLDKYGDNAIINRIGDFFTWNKEHFDSERISAYQTILAANSPAARQYQEYAKQKHIEEIERQIRELNKPPSYGLDPSGCFSSSLLPDDGVLAHGMEYLYNLLNSHNTLFSCAV